MLKAEDCQKPVNPYFLGKNYLFKEKENSSLYLFATAVAQYVNLLSYSKELKTVTIT